MHENFTNDMDELLVKYLLEEASGEERNEVEQWLKASIENQRRFDHFQLLWAESKKLAVTIPVNENEAWEEFKANIEKQERDTQQKIAKRAGRKTYLLAAAAVLLLITVGIWYYSVELSGRGNQVLAQAFDSVTTKTLDDGSVITLNKHSILKKDSRSRLKRAVILEGEAFFNVAPDQSNPFVISVDSVEVRVVGTSFNVKKTTKGTEIIVETGLVEVLYNGKKVLLKPGEKVLASNQTNTFITEKTTDQLYKFFRTKELLCDNTPLWQLVESLNEAYGSNIIIKDSSVRQLPISASFNNQSLEMILDVVEKTLSVTIERKGTAIEIKTK